MNMKTSQRGINLIKEFEGCELESYLCSANVPTIGYGHTASVKVGDRITQDKAEQLLREDLAEFEAAVNGMVEVPITQCQFDALVAFAFNVGISGLGSSTALNRLNQGKHAAAADALLWWNKVDGVVVDGLTRRRQAERRLFYGQAFLGQ
ncbi:MAG: lysozyme [Microcoleus sp.]